MNPVTPVQRPFGDQALTPVEAGYWPRGGAGGQPAGAEAIALLAAYKASSGLLMIDGLRQLSRAEPPKRP